MTYSLIIPIYNEERTLPTLLHKLGELQNDNIEIIIIDDGSNDNTQNILRKETPFITLRNDVNKGKGASIKKAVKSAKNQNIILIDGDLEIDINDVPNLILKYENTKSDILTGVRWGDQSNKQKYDINLLGNQIINFIFNILFKSNFSDVLCCVKILNLKIFKFLNIQSSGFSIEVETMAKLVLNQFTIEETSVKYIRRKSSEGKKLKFSDSWHIIWTMLKIRLRKI